MCWKKSCVGSAPVKMDARQAAEMQMLIRNNNEDLQDYMKGLETWEDEIRAKDSDLSRRKPILKEQLPPVRSHEQREHKRKRRKKKKKVQVVDSKAAGSRISSYDYHSWDRFDVDKACEEVDYEVKSSSSSYESSSDEDEETRAAQQRQQAIAEKEKGNTYFKRHDYELAVECYARAMELDPSSAVMPANRAMALLKLERYAAAEMDCTVALELDGTYVKAFLRRATARAKLRKFVLARQDFESVLKIEPANKLALAELEKLDKEVGTSGVRYLRPVKRPPHLRSKKPLKRIMIEQIDAATAVSPQSVQNSQPSLHNGQPSATTSSQPLTTSSIPTATSCNTEAQSPRTASQCPHPPADSTVEEIGNIHSTTSNQSSEAVQPIARTNHSTEAVTTSQGHGQPSKAKSDSTDSISLATPCSKIVELSETRTSQSSMTENQTTPGVESAESTEMRTAVPKTQATPSSDATPKDTLPGATRMLVSDVETEDQRGGQLVGAESGCLLKMPSVPPTSSIQFQADWKKLRRDRNMLAQYFKAIPTQQYPSLLQQSLETDAFHDIVSILHQDFVKCGVVCLEQLSALTKVKRFAVSLMFLSKSQKQSLVTLFEDLLKLVEGDEEKLKVRHLAKQFSVLLS